MGVNARGCDEVGRQERTPLRQCPPLPVRRPLGAELVVVSRHVPVDPEVKRHGGGQLGPYDDGGSLFFVTV